MMFAFAERLQGVQFQTASGIHEHIFPSTEGFFADLYTWATYNIVRLAICIDHLSIWFCSTEQAQALPSQALEAQVLEAQALPPQALEAQALPPQALEAQALEVVLEVVLEAVLEAQALEAQVLEAVLEAHLLPPQALEAEKLEDQTFLQRPLLIGVRTRYVHWYHGDRTGRRPQGTSNHLRTF